MANREEDLLQNLARVSRTRDDERFQTNTHARRARDDPHKSTPINIESASEVLEQVYERRVDLEAKMKMAPNGRARSPLRKEHWWLGYLAELLEKWIVLGRL